MKKILATLLILLAISLLTGCSVFPTREKQEEAPMPTLQKEEKEEVKKEPGVIETIGNYYSPKKNFDKANNAKRKAELGTILNAVVYIKAFGAIECGADKTKIPACDDTNLNGSAFDGAMELGIGAGKLDCGKELSSMLAKIPVNPGPGNAPENTGYFVCEQNGRTYVLVGGGVVDETGECNYPGNPENYPEEITKEDKVMCVSG